MVYNVRVISNFGKHLCIYFNTAGNTKDRVVDYEPTERSREVNIPPQRGYKG